MPVVKGRGRKEPVVSTGFTGRGILFRIDDNAEPAFWLAIEFTPLELEQLLDQRIRWEVDQIADRMRPDPPAASE